MAAIFVLLTLLLSVINVTDFALAAQDADKMTQMLSEENGVFGREREKPKDGWRFGRSGPMGPASPETQASLRYFTFAFDAQGGARKVAFEMNSLSEAEAEQWARSLTDETTGWTRVTYRYRTYKKDGMTFVTVIDQGRELLSAYRILIISAVGEAVVLLVAFAVLTVVSGKLLDPVAAADRKQKRFIAEIETNFKVPLTVVSAGTELIEREHGATDITTSMRRQLRKMTALVKDLGNLAVLDDGAYSLQPLDLSALCEKLLKENEQRFADRGIRLEGDVLPGVTIKGDAAAVEKSLAELFDNLYQFAQSRAMLTLTQTDGRVRLTFLNDTDLPQGRYDQAFDRFTRLDNAKGLEGAGLGLSHVREVVRAHNGRIEALVDGDNMFTVRISI